MDNNDLSTLKILLGMKDSSPDDLMTRVEETQGKIAEAAKESKAAKVSMNDAYGNSITGSGTDDKIKSFTSYGFSNDSMNWMLWTALYNDSWVFRRAIDKPAQDMVRSGVELQTDSERRIDIIDKVQGQRKSLIELIQWGRLYGGAIGVMMFDCMKDDDYAKPIDALKIQRAKKLSIYVTDRWYGCVQSEKTVNDMSSLDYSKPESYTVTFANGKSMKVHHDWILRYEGRTAPRLVKNGMLQGWGYAEGAHIINELARDDQLKASITSLVNKSLIEVIKMPGMRGIFMGADKENEQQIQKRLEMVNWARNYNSLTFLDKDDEYQEHGFGGLGGLSSLLENNMWLISSALEMQGILYGDLKNGFSTDSEALERYDEVINNLNESYFRPCMQKLIHNICVWLDVKDDVTFTFGSLVKGKLDKDRIEGMKDFQQLLSSMLQDGVLSLKQYGIAMKSYAEKGIIDLGMSDKDIDNLDDKMDEEMENLGIDEMKNDFGGVKTEQ